MNEQETIIYILELTKAMKIVSAGVQMGRIVDSETVRQSYASAHKERQRVIVTTAQFGVTNPLLNNGLPSESYWRWFEEWHSWAQGLSPKQYTQYKERVLEQCGITNELVNTSPV